MAWSRSAWASTMVPRSLLVEVAAGSLTAGSRPGRDCAILMEMQLVGRSLHSGAAVWVR